MLNRYPLWKNLMVILVVAIGALYSLPNIYGEDPAVQISGTRGQQADTTALTEVQNVLKENNLPTKSIVLENGSILARFTNTDDQLLAKDKIAEKTWQQLHHSIKPCASNSGLVKQYWS